MTTRLNASVAFSLEARAVWLFFRNDGSWWSVASATDYWRPTFEEAELRELLEALRAGLHVERRAPSFAHRDWAYAVTAECRPLPGLSLLPSTFPKESHEHASAR